MFGKFSLSYRFSFQDKSSKAKADAKDQTCKSVQDESVYVKVKRKDGKELLTLGKGPNPYAVKNNEADKTKQDTTPKIDVKSKEDKIAKSDTTTKANDTTTQSNKVITQSDKSTKEKNKAFGPPNKTSKSDVKSETKTDDKVSVSRF